MAELIVHVANCLLVGEEISRFPDGSWTRNIIRFRIHGREVVLRQNKDYVANPNSLKFSGAFVAATSLVFPNTIEDEISSLIDLADKLCELLSFVTESRVVRFGHDFPTDGVAKQRRSVLGTVETFRPPFETADGSRIRQFVEMCFSTFLQFRDRRRLNVVFDYLYFAGKRGLAVEIQLSSLFILLENLKHTHAEDIGHPFIKGFFRNHGATTAHPGPKLSFENLLNAMFTAVGMNPNMTQIISLRNELIHSGLVAMGGDNMFRLLEQIQDIIREYLFRLLQFNGRFACYTLGKTMSVP